MKRFTTKLESRLFSITITIDSALEDLPSEKQSSLPPQPGQKESHQLFTSQSQELLNKVTQKFAHKLIQILSKDQ